jgi:hypothetical protein
MLGTSEGDPTTSPDSAADDTRVHIVRARPRLRWAKVLDVGRRSGGLL